MNENPYWENQTLHGTTRLVVYRKCEAKTHALAVDCQAVLSCTLILEEVGFHLLHVISRLAHGASALSHTRERGGFPCYHCYYMIFKKYFGQVI